MALKRVQTPVPAPESIERVILDARPRKIESLWAQQADVLRSYDASSASDIAIRLPTGSGKTLVGIAIAEWRRTIDKFRCVYLCPTNQLVNQVAKHARDYGIKVEPFTGKKANYANTAKAAFLTGDVPAVTSYSSLFNIKPFFENPQLIILDDAHAAESYIAALWTLRIRRSSAEEAPLYSQLIEVLRPALSVSTYQKLADAELNDYWDAQWVDMVSTPELFLVHDSVVALLDAWAPKLDSVRYSWRSTREHLLACHVYVSPGEVLIRPLLPPTRVHEPFASANQRVYMSATLGRGGDLERITGRPLIERLPVPGGWERQAIGRRLFLMPGLSLDESGTKSVVEHLARRAGRTLILTTDDRSAEKWKEWVKSTLRFRSFDAEALEASKDDFIATDRAVAIAANRYDGIDLPSDECRLLIIDGLPLATNLQERFLIHRMSARQLYADRVLTRVTQAFGRCTRSPNDYSAVVLLGEGLTRYVLLPENTGPMHPELAAELQFGVQQSRGADVTDFVQAFEALMAQGEEWKLAEEDIQALRAAAVQVPPAGIDELAEAAPHEVKYQEAIWRSDYMAALDQCRDVLAKLESPELRGYRALWQYLAGSAAYLAAKNGSPGFEQYARDHFTAAAKAAPDISWLVTLARRSYASGSEHAVSEIDSGAAALGAQIERLEGVFDQHGMLLNHRFERKVADVMARLASREAHDFEAGQVGLGELLGFEAGKVEERGSPDPWWRSDDDFIIVFESHSKAGADSILSVGKARQVATHPNWIRDKLPNAKDAKILPVLVTPVSKLEREALPHLIDVRVFRLDDFRTWATTAIATVRRLRETYPGPGNAEWRSAAAIALDNAGATAGAFARAQRETPASSIMNPVGHGG